LGRLDGVFSSVSSFPNRADNSLTNFSTEALFFKGASSNFSYSTLTKSSFLSSSSATAFSTGLDEEAIHSAKAGDIVLVATTVLPLRFLGKKEFRRSRRLFESSPSSVVSESCNTSEMADPNLPLLAASDKFRVGARVDLMKLQHRIVESLDTRGAGTERWVNSVGNAKTVVAAVVIAAKAAMVLFLGNHITRSTAGWFRLQTSTAQSRMRLHYDNQGSLIFCHS
jgi:hypothetical protein